VCRVIAASASLHRESCIPQHAIHCLCACSPALKSFQVRGAHALSLMALCLHRASRARPLARGRLLLWHASDVRERRSLFGLHCDSMLRAGNAPVGYRGARVGCNCVERHVVNSFGASARAGRLQPPLGFRCALRRCSLRVPVPHLALRARRESLPGASLRARSRGERAAEVRLDFCLTVLSLTGPVVLQAPQAGAPNTVWVKRKDVAGAQYVAVKGVDLQQTVDDFKARWVAQAKLDVDPSLVTLRLVKSSEAEPEPDEEANAKELRPRLTLASAGLTDGCSLLAFTTKSALSAPPLVFALLDGLSSPLTQAPRYPMRLWLHANLPCLSWMPLCSRCESSRPR